MTLQQMEYILAVYRYKQFAKAAEHCNVTQPTLSSMVQKLEDELGLKIFDRRVQPIAPTPTGKLILEQAWRTVERARKIKEIAQEEKNSLCGTFKIGILPTIAPYLLPRFFPQLMKEHPEADLRVVEMKTQDIKRALLDGDIDAAIVAHLDNMESFEQTPLFYEQFFAYVAHDDALAACKQVRVADLTHEFLWLLDEGHCFRDQLVKFCKLKAARKSQSTYSLGSIETFMRMVENGKGVTFIPELALLQLTEEQRSLVRPFAIPIPTRQIVLLTTTDFVRHAMSCLLTRAIQGCVPQEMLTLDNTRQRV